MFAGAISPDDPRAPDVRALLACHLAFCNEHTPPEDVHALDFDDLAHPDISFFSARLDGALLGVGARWWITSSPSPANAASGD